MRQSKFAVLLLSVLVALLSLLPVPLVQAKETDQDMSLSPVGGEAMVDPFTGSLSTSIPIQVPPGRHGMQPNLALTYWSGGGNGWVGMGWKLEMGAIERQTRFGINYSGDDYTFRLSGNSGDLTNIGSGEYRAKIEGGFSRVRKLTASDGQPYWEITEKNGTRYLFGQTAASRMADPADAGKIFKWCLDRVEDTNGNYLTVTYWSDQGQGYLDHIDYTGNTITGALPTNTIKFYSESRPDAQDMYNTNFRVRTAYRLKTIDVQASGQRVRSYRLSYVIGGTTSHSLISTVQQLGKDSVLDASGTVSSGTALPASIVAYSPEYTGFGAETTWGAMGWDAPSRYRAADFNGDGKTDVLFIYSDGTSEIFKAKLSTGDSFGPETYWGAMGWDDLSRYFLGDFNGDGKSDILFIISMDRVSYSKSSCPLETALIPKQIGELWDGTI